MLQVGVADGVEDYGRVFAAELDADGNQCFRGRGTDDVGDWPRADEGDVRYSWVRSQVVGGLGPADERLDEVSRVATSGEGIPCD